MSRTPGVSVEFLPDIYEAPYDPFSTMNDGELLSFISHISNLSKNQHGIEAFVDSDMIQLILSTMRSIQNNDNEYFLDFYHNLQSELFSRLDSVDVRVLDIVRAIQAPGFKGIVVATGYKAHSTKLYIGKSDLGKFFVHYIDLGPGYKSFGKKISHEKVSFYNYPITVDIPSREFSDCLTTILSQNDTPSKAAISVINAALNSLSKEGAPYLLQGFPSIRFQQNGYCTLESLMAAHTIHAHYNGVSEPRKVVFNSVILPIYTLARDYAQKKQLDINIVINSGSVFETPVYIYDIDDDYSSSIELEIREYYVYKNGSHINCVFRKSNGNQLNKELIPELQESFLQKLNKKGFSQKICMMICLKFKFNYE